MVLCKRFLISNIFGIFLCFLENARIFGIFNKKGILTKILFKFNNKIPYILCCNKERFLIKNTRSSRINFLKHMPRDYTKVLIIKISER